MSLVSAILSVLALTLPAAWAEPGQPSNGVPAAEAKPTANVKYKAGKSLDFEQLLIQGALKRPEITVVTGNASQGADGLLRLRENFLDRMATDAGEEIK